METREVLLKADKVSVVFERIADGKIRVTTSSWDDAKVLWPNQVLEVATIGKQVGLVRVDKPIAYLDIDETGLAEAGTVRRRNESQRDSDLSQRDSDEVTRFMASAAERMRFSRISFLCPHAMAIFPICSPSNTPPREVICNDDQDVIQRAASNRGGGDGTDDVAKPEPMSVV